MTTMLGRRPAKEGDAPIRVRRPLRVWLARAATVVAAALLVAFTLAPLVAILGTSVTPAPYWEFPPSGFTLRWYEQFFADDALVRSAVVSLLTGLLAGTMGTAVALVAALGIGRTTSRAGKVLGVVVLLPLLVPNIVLGLGVYTLYNAWGVRVNVLLLSLAQLVVVLPITVRTLMVAVAGVAPNVERAAANLGAGPARVFWMVTIPMIRPSLVAASVLGFVVAFDDSSIALFVNSASTITLPVRMLLTLDQESGPLVAAAGSLLLLVAVLLIVVLEFTVGLAKALGVADRR
ncbi:ABC transporter permease [Phytohabitans kaempferiae]|uniref:ABC transporter permease n=1 Tax=Phytohabitans kaempferiae TaxID=1620943 RepID=A0ABV6M771_9ACTN